MNDYPSPETIEAEARRIEQSARAVSDTSEYPRVAVMACSSQVSALRDYAATIREVIGDTGIPQKRPGMTGEERRTRRAAILRLRAARLKVKSADLHRQSHDIGAHIPFGQPILVGHHSERRHRKTLERINRATGEAFATEEYANTLESRAASVERAGAISASDYDAIEQYQAKIADLENERDRMKAMNAAYRAFRSHNDKAPFYALGETDESIARIDAQIQAAGYRSAPYESYSLSNRGAVIRDTKAKLANALQRATMPTREIVAESTGLRFEDAPADNRVRLFFPGKPDAETRTTLKRHGFRWAPSLGCWQAYRNNRSLWFVDKFMAEPVYRRSEKTS